MTFRNIYGKEFDLAGMVQDIELFINEDEDSVYDLIKIADDALYKAKKNNKNKVIKGN